MLILHHLACVNYTYAHITRLALLCVCVCVCEFIVRMYYYRYLWYPCITRVFVSVNCYIAYINERVISTHENLCASNIK